MQTRLNSYLDIFARCNAGERDACHPAPRSFRREVFAWKIGPLSYLLFRNHPPLMSNTAKAAAPGSSPLTGFQDLRCSGYWLISFPTTSLISSESAGGAGVCACGVGRSVVRERQSQLQSARKLGPSAGRPRDFPVAGVLACANQTSMVSGTAQDVRSLPTCYNEQP